jgi:hypothetical protein
MAEYEGQRIQAFGGKAVSRVEADVFGRDTKSLSNDFFLMAVNI